MSTKKILDKLEKIEEDVSELKTSQRLIEQDINTMKTNHLAHTEKSLQMLWKWSLAIGTLIILMFVDETQTLIKNYLTK